MTSAYATAHNSIVALLVGNSRRATLLPDYVQSSHCHLMLRNVFDTMTKLSKDYNGGYWEYWELSNNSFFMIPKTRPNYHVNYSGFSGILSAEATGIIASMIAFKAMARDTKNFHYLDLHHSLIEWAKRHWEWNNIVQATKFQEMGESHGTSNRE